MKFVPLLLSLTITILLIVAFNIRWGKTPPLGEFLSPQHGFWQNAEPLDKDYTQDLQVAGIKDPAEIYLDDRLVPHIFAANDADAYYLQGYLHAKFRLFQMDLQTKAAEGRASEIAGKKAITHSILMRAKSRTVRYIRAVHDLETKTIHLRSVQREAKI